MRGHRLLSLCLGAAWLAACSGTVGSGGGGGQAQPPDPPPPPVHPTWPQSIGTLPATAEPRPISGGTLLVLKDDHTAVAADSDQDAVWIVDLTTLKLVGTVGLQAGDEPGRVVEDASGRIHVALRGGAAVATIDPADATITRRPVCSQPRGLAYDPAQDAIHVACADGMLVTLPAGGGDATRAVHVDSDLRDIVLQNGKLYVSRFRTAELLEVADDGSVAQRITIPTATAPSMNPNGNGMSTAQPGVAYRTIGLPGGGIAMLHQRSQLEQVSTMPGGYSDFGMCPGVGMVHDAVTSVTPGMDPQVAAPLMMVTVAVDVAVRSDGLQIAVAAPSSQGMSVGTYPWPMPEAAPGTLPPPCFPPNGNPVTAGQPVAVAFTAGGTVVSQTRNPASVVINGYAIALPSPGPSSGGMDTFYTSTKGSIACASCHPEGGDDGRVWQFDTLGARRTQNLRGGVLARAPFHWSGDIADMTTLATVVFEGRMIGPMLDPNQIADLGAWMDAQPAFGAPAPSDADAVARGKTLFQDPTVGCASCHFGPQLSNHALVDVGTGGLFKVPSLIGVGYRAPYMHTGCAATLTDRFDPSCGGGDTHGHTSQLDAGQISDLVAYLESL